MIYAAMKKRSAVMILDMVQDAIWGIIPEKLDAVHQVLWKHMNHQKIDISDSILQVGMKISNTYGAYTTNDRVAILPIYGILAKKMNIFMELICIMYLIVKYQMLFLKIAEE